MHKTIQALLVVQDRDLRILQLKADIDRVPSEKAAAEGRLSDDRRAVEKAETARKEAEVAIRTLETSIATRRDSIAKLTTQQFETKKQDEYTALGSEIERYKETITGMEDEELELMEKVEQIQAELAEASSALARTQELVDEEIGQLDDRSVKAGERVVELTAERDRLAGDIDGDVLEDYEYHLGSKGDAVVVPLKHGVCSGCHMKVNAGARTLAKTNEISNCDNCGRFLHFLED